MSRPRVLRAVTKNFLGTYTSRYTDRDGYWLFGFLADGPPLDIDLLGDRYRRSEEPAEDARLFAMDAFLDQLMKAKLPESRLRTGRLAISASPTPVEQLAGGLLRKGREVIFTVAVTTDRGGKYGATCTKFVAPHDRASNSGARDGSRDREAHSVVQCRVAAIAACAQPLHA
jgi:hypothetical protein